SGCASRHSLTNTVRALSASGRTLFEDYHLVRSAEASVAATATSAHTQDILIRATTMGRNIVFLQTMRRSRAAVARRTRQQDAIAIAGGILLMMKTLRASGVETDANGLSHKRTTCTLLAHRASQALLMVCLGRLVRVDSLDAAI